MLPDVFDLAAPDQYALVAASTNLGGGLTVSQVEEPVKRHRCGLCANPHTYGREDCPKNKERD
ncbi:hypothetical protein EDF60_1652 [Leucobacter luti]|nr:hypothetical protein [Leucobacter luti]TCK41227.1 hypothetical protein EDF60_1652 [Leucobacter luti]